MYIYIFPALTDSTTTSASKPGRSCRPGMFLCNYPDNRCIPNFWRCDGIEDCWDKADEKGCSTTTETTIKSTLPTTSLRPQGIFTL